MMQPTVLFAEMVTWLTPFWLVTCGAALGLVVLAMLFGAIYLAGEKFPGCRVLRENLLVMLREGFLLPLLCLAGVLTLIAGFSLLEVNANGFALSLLRLPFIHNIEEKLELKQGDKPDTRTLPAGFRAAELSEWEVHADREVTLKIRDENSTRAGFVAVVTPDEPWIWKRGAGAENPFAGQVNDLEVQYAGTKPATVKMTAKLNVEFPEVWLVLGTAGSFVALVVFYVLFWHVLPKVAAIAAAACQEGMSQPLFYLVLALGLFSLTIFVIIPYNTFGEDIKMYKTSGVVLILILSLAVALWTSSVSISEEIEGRTAVTVLSKPIGRWEFVLGKFIGVLGPVLLLFIILGVFFLAANSFKTVYDARESAKEAPIWRDCYREMVTVIPGLYLGLLATVCISAVSVALSTRLPMLPNLILCATVYVVGYLVPQIVKSKAGQSELVVFFGQLIATVFPVLEHFNIESAIMRGTDVPLDYLLYATGYAAAFSTGAILLGLFLFEDRDVA